MERAESGRRKGNEDRKELLRMRVSDISTLENVRERHSATIVILSILIAPCVN